MDRGGRRRVTRVGVFGGTFDPVHVGHLAIANAALDELGLDRVYFVPARRSPLKQDGPVASAEARLAMLTSATATEPRFKVAGIELDRRGPSFTGELDARDFEARLGGGRRRQHREASF